MGGDTLKRGRCRNKPTRPHHHREPTLLLYEYHRSWVPGRGVGWKRKPLGSSNLTTPDQDQVMLGRVIYWTHQYAASPAGIWHGCHASARDVRMSWTTKHPWLFPSRQQPSSSPFARAICTVLAWRCRRISQCALPSSRYARSRRMTITPWPRYARPSRPLLLPCDDSHASLRPGCCTWHPSLLNRSGRYTIHSTYTIRSHPKTTARLSFIWHLRANIHPILISWRPSSIVPTVHTCLSRR